VAIPQAPLAWLASCKQARAEGYSVSVRISHLAVLAAACLAACAGSSDSPHHTCAGAKCDLPEGEDKDFCAARREDAFNANHYAFTEDFLRWSCNDVEGVTEEDRGQEYCEYFAIVALPPETADGEQPPPAVLGRNLGPDYSYGTTDTKLDLDFNQLSALEADESAVVGQCIFTSWNSDIPGPVPSCQSGTCPSVMGVEVDEDNFRMHFDVNSAEAAQLLVRDCATLPKTGDPDDEDNPRRDDFTRGCLHNAEINGTAFRKSDSDVCAASIRLAECGCSPRDGDFETFISPYDRRGFPLGTWSSPHELPSGCRYVELGDDSQTVVSCDLTASDVINYALDLKTHCQTKYADNVVVHVPMPASSAIECVPDPMSPYSDTCDATPWVLKP
jgi:hypothetical protein